jgi:hypothetical protein
VTGYVKTNSCTDDQPTFSKVFHKDLPPRASTQRRFENSESQGYICASEEAVRQVEAIFSRIERKGKPGITDAEKDRVGSSTGSLDTLQIHHDSQIGT